MRQIKLKALRLRRYTGKTAWLYAALRLLAAAGAGVSFLLSGLCLFHGTDAVFEGFPLYADAAAFLPPFFFPVAIGAAGVLFTVFAADLHLCFRAVFFRAADRDGRKPASLLGFRTGCRALYCAARQGLAKTGFLALLLFPLLLTGAATVFCLRARGLTPGLCLLFSAVGTVQLLTAAELYLVLRERYAMTWYLLYQNPLLTGREAIRSGVLLTDGRLLPLALSAARMLPWALASLLILPLPFAVGYRQTVRALVCEKIYGENRKMPVSPAVTFYISSRSSFRARRDPCEAPTDNPTQ